MNENETRALVEEWVDAWNAAEPERMRALYTPDAVLYQAPQKKALVGVDHIIERWHAVAGIANDSRFTLRELHVAGDTAILEFNVAGTHTTRFLDFEPTGRGLDIDSCLVFKVENGKITKHTTYLDTATILRALGLLEIPGVREEAA